MLQHVIDFIDGSKLQQSLRKKIASAKEHFPCCTCRFFLLPDPSNCLLLLTAELFWSFVPCQFFFLPFLMMCLMWTPSSLPHNCDCFCVCLRLSLIKKCLCVNEIHSFVFLQREGSAVSRISSLASKVCLRYTIISALKQRKYNLYQLQLLKSWKWMHGLFSGILSIPLFDGKNVALLIKEFF